jgi:DNA-binding MltR family transcriptional regulator
MMPRDLSEAVEILKEHGLDFVKLILDTHAETMLRLGSLLEDFLEIALKHQMLQSGKAVNERAFGKGGKLGTLADKIKRAKTVGLLDDVTYTDADLLREIRNEFAHLKTKIHFESARIVEFATGLSTYKAAETTQDVILAAGSKVMDKLRESVPRRG